MEGLCLGLCISAKPEETYFVDKRVFLECRAWVSFFTDDNEVVIWPLSDLIIEGSSYACYFFLLLLLSS